MKKIKKLLVGILVLSVFRGGVAFGNGGPFVIKYPNGDPAAKGVLARLSPDLRPGREDRLRVIKEDLTVKFDKAPYETDGPPLVKVSAAYTIENPTDKEIEVDFGFPILRGIYMPSFAMVPMPDVHVRLGDKYVNVDIISNSAIYGIIRQRCREVIDRAVSENKELSRLVASVREASTSRETARRSLFTHLTKAMKWNEGEAALMVEYASVDFGNYGKLDASPAHFFWSQELVKANLGPLAAIGEQKATQFFTQLASCFDSQTAAAYESIFASWGGDVRERALDIKTGKIRPREVTVASKGPADRDSTIYARVDYFDEKVKIRDSEKASCQAILKNLPVIFTFAPMNLLYYQAKFPAKSTQTLTVSYSQYAYADTHAPSSYQFAYVVYPASMWEEFGPINLEVAVPEGIPFYTSVPCKNEGAEERPDDISGAKKVRYDVYHTVLKNKIDELYLAVDKEACIKARRTGNIGKQ